MSPLRTGLAVAAFFRAACAFAAPGGEIDLRVWKLQLPVDSGGKVKEVSGSRLAAGYSDAYFYRTEGGAIVFWAPVSGATTENSHYPRSELRQTEPGDWALSGTHTLLAACRVTQLPRSGKVVIGQIHGGNSNAQVCKLYWNKGSVEFHYKDDSGKEHSIKLGTYKLGEIVHYQIRCADKVISVTVNGHTASHSYAAAEWQHDRYYFKAGSYCQDNSGSPGDGARVEFTSLETSP